MNREEQISNANPYAGSSDTGFGKMVGFKAGAKWADEHPVSPWISVEERLPEYTQFNAKRYIAKVEYGSMVKEYQTAVVWMQNKFKFNIEMDWVKVTHWMEIPE